MIPLPQATTKSKPLHDMLNGAIHARMLQAAIGLGVFEHLDSFCTAEKVAAKLDAHEQNTRFFLDALATIGLITKNEGRYRNTTLAQAYLVSESPLFLGPLFKMIQSMSIKPLDQIEKCMRNGPFPPKPETNFSSQSIWTDGARAGAAWALGEMGNQVAGIVASLPGFADFETMLDLGGGHGLFAMYMVQVSKKLKAVVFDRPGVVQVAQEYIEAYGMNDRAGVMAGNFMEDDIGQGYDLIWASATMSVAKKELDSLIAKVHAALKAKGYFLSLHDGMTHELTQPDTNLGWLGNLMSTGMDYRFEQGEIAESMLRCGFQSIRSRTIDTPMGALDLDIARKDR
jgi:hypothetical protein